VRLDVTTETEESAAEAMGKVGLGVAQLAGGVYDSGVRISFVGKLNAPCGQSGCNVSAVVKNESASAAVTVVLQGRVTAGASLLATCASPGKSISAGKTAPISCQAGGAKWVTFYRRATRPSRAPRTTPYLVQGIAVATAKPPRSATCSIEAAIKGKASPAPPCPKPTITDDGFDHSLKHAKEWWGRRTLTDADVAEWRRMVETAQRSTKRFPWSSRTTLTTAHLTRVGGRYFVAQFDRKTGKLVTAFGPNPGQVREMLKLLGT
jgi:hypothetical protein